MLKFTLCCLLACCSALIPQDHDAFRAPRRIRVSAQVLAGFLEHGVNPVYPDEAIAAGISGSVVLVLQTDEHGKVVKALVIDGPPLLAAASIEALQEFRFRPYSLAGAPIAVESQIEFRFVLDGKGKGTDDYTFQVPYRPEFRTGAVNENGVLVLSPRKISGPDPLLLPELAGKTGSVYLTLRIGTDGKVEDVKVVGGSKELVGPVVAAVKQEIYDPQTVDGKPIAATIEASYHLGGSRK